MGVSMFVLPNDKLVTGLGCTPPSPIVAGMELATKRDSVGSEDEWVDEKFQYLFIF